MLFDELYLKTERIKILLEFIRDNGKGNSIEYINEAILLCDKLIQDYDSKASDAVKQIDTLYANVDHDNTPKAIREDAILILLEFVPGKVFETYMSNNF
jgi:hypothetical protein